MRRPSLRSIPNPFSHGRPRAARAASRSCATPAEFHVGRPPRLFRRHAAPDLLLHGHRQVRVQLLVEVSIRIPGSKEAKKTGDYRVEERLHACLELAIMTTHPCGMARGVCPGLVWDVKRRGAGWPRGPEPRAQSLQSRSQSPYGAESQADVIGPPAAVCVAQRGTQPLLDFLHRRFAVGAKAIERRSLEDPEPSPYARRQRGRPRDEGNLLDGESVHGEPRPVFVVARVVAADARRKPSPRQHALYRGLDRRDVAVAAELGDEAATVPQRPRNPVEEGIVISNPVQRRIREHRVELVLEGECLRVNQPRVETASPRRIDHLLRAVDARRRPLRD